jgi:uncharacterized Rossmann fold enzyme
MDFKEWEPLYEQILADFGYGRSGDRAARDRLQSVFTDQVDGVPDQVVRETLETVDFTGATVAVVGGAPTLDSELDAVGDVDAVVAASNAAARLRTAGIPVDCMVTDLDKTPETAAELSHEGTPVAVHAHGDNVELVETHVPALDPQWVVPTTQAKPTEMVHNFGGFTDGDRAAYLADTVGAKRLRFYGWDITDETVTPEKSQKLRWASRLLELLERRRNEEFDILDGLREQIAPL